MFSAQLLHHLIHSYGYGVVGLMVFLESMGMPLPGESLLIGAALYAAATHHLNIGFVVLAASIGAIAGDNMGYLIGRSLGPGLLVKFGRWAGITQQRLVLGQYLFRRHGGKVVFFGRFMVLLRTFAALLAGVIGMHWKDFLIWNAAGGITWCALYGFGAYSLGAGIEKIKGPLGITAAIAAALGIAAFIWFVKKNEHRLTEEALREAERESALTGRQPRRMGAAVE